VAPRAIGAEAPIGLTLMDLGGECPVRIVRCWRGRHDLVDGVHGSSAGSGGGFGEGHRGPIGAGHQAEVEVFQVERKRRVGRCRRVGVSCHDGGGENERKNPRPLSTGTSKMKSP